MDRLWIDLETYSTVDLRTATPYRYAEDPEFLVLMAAWSIDGETVNVAIGDEQINEIPGLFDPDVVKVAHNAPFERICLSYHFGLAEYGAYLPADQWHDTQAIAGELGYPQGLGKLAAALGADPKDEAGTRLINLFCKPNREGVRNLPEDHPTAWLDFVMYCDQDVATLIDVDRRLGGWPTETERRVYLADQAVNDVGIKVDTEMARAAVAAAADNAERDTADMRALTGLANPNSQQQMMEWCRSVGLKNENLTKETVESLLAGDLHPDVRRVLELRQELALVASKKFSAALGAVSGDDRLRGSFRFFGAHTGRWTGRGVQLQNLASSQLETESDTETAILDLLMGDGADPATLKALVRSMFLGPLTVVDYAAIEARVVAWLAGEQWAMQAFRDGRDIYVETADRMGGLTRKQGKVAVLALGYNGAVGSLRAMGATGNDAELARLVSQWRAANRRIVQLWEVMNNAFRTGGPVGEHLSIEKDGKDRYLRLPSGRAICYRRCTFGNRPSFMSPKGVRTQTYGGRLTENATQAVARDLLAEALVRLVDRGYTVVGHVHDEILVEGEHSVADVTKTMVEVPDWAAGLPIDGEGFTCNRYRKG